MHSIVRQEFAAFSEKFEGAIPFMYLDVKGLVTVGIGNLIDPMGQALALPFVRKADQMQATMGEITTEFQRVKERQELARVGYRAFAPLTRLMLTPEGIDLVVSRKLDANEAFLFQRFPDFSDWPADAQLATHSMAWACGPAFHFPKLEAALLRADFETAAIECKMNEAGNPGLHPRNIANALLYRNAEYARGAKLDPELLFYPGDLQKMQQDDTPTQPGLDPVSAYLDALGRDKG